MVLWVGGEARYLQRNYMKLLPILGIDVDVTEQNEFSLDRQGGGPKSFAEMEEEAIGKDGRNVMELLPRFGGETHVLISTRLPNAINVQPLRLLHLSVGEAMSLMRDTLGDLPTEDVDALRVLEEKLVQDMVSFIKQIVLPLAMHDLKAFSQYTSALELLRLATEKLEAMEDSFLSEGDNSSNKSAVQIAPNIYYEFAHLRATLLESRAKLMIRVLQRVVTRALTVVRIKAWMIKKKKNRDS
ncbi:hypothetical protein J5N97_000416 [Dioscorea zingiberensis]|uniref:Uncharacterized protein n=1 Tax=Dioscorea zingiberensis TaxID=325984 RepID=A0A9D5H2W6_9LILI|nr:hypothetical protein J5N97_000416 [Dioscorea zingiberensis]